jgi:hypothetical protein
MHPLAIKLSDAFKRDFASADRDIKWYSAEEERMLWLDKHTVIVGRIDATGVNAEAKPFFAEWKTLSKNKARNMDAVKAEWRMSPQALTYGVLLAKDLFHPFTGDSEINVLAPPVRDFTVRWAIKTEPPTTAFEWYSYTEAELKWWADQLLYVASSIRYHRTGQPEWNWPTNLTNCTRYGWNYRCPFWDNGCSKLKFDHVPDGMTPRDPHLAIEKTIRADLNHVDDTELVILDATRTKDWMSCHEYYRRLWEPTVDANGLVQLGLSESSEALTIGTDFHSEADNYITELINGRAS